MSERKQFVAFDLGATSGRTIVGTLGADRSLVLEELTRFPNRMLSVGGRLYWNIYSLLEHIKDGLRAVAKAGIVPASVGIDTWGVDFGCVASDGSVIGLPRAYRDSSTVGAHTRFFGSVMSAEELYGRTGIQHMGFNTIFQFNEQKDTFAVRNADKIAFIPDLLAYLLTGNIVTEYTIASTGAVLNPSERALDEALLAAVGLDAGRFGPMVLPGTVIGVLSEEVAREVGLPQVPVVAVAGHDTASAVAAIPAEGKNWAYLSSGTWSLMGIETDSPVINDVTMQNNITNEGGVDGTIRLLKNITGMWIVEECLRAWKSSGVEYTYPQMVELAGSARPFACFIDPDDESFVCPPDMPQAIDAYCIRTGQNPPETHGEYIRSIFESLALKYRKVLDVFRSLSTVPVDRLHVIGGGSRNALLNRFTANAISLPVLAGPAECSSIGNIMLQAKATGAVDSLQEMRRIIGGNFTPETYLPEDTEIWEKAYQKYIKLITAEKS